LFFPILIMFIYYSVVTVYSVVLGDEKKMSQKTKIECMECGHKFSRTIGAHVVEVECPKCHGVDVEVA